MPQNRTPGVIADVRRDRVAQLLARHCTSLRAYILACVRHAPDAEDIFQEVAVAVTASIDALHDEAGFLPWAREIARRRLLAFYRGRNRERPIDPELARTLYEAAERLEQSRPASDHYATLLACLEELPPRSRRLIRKRYNGSSADELAQLYGQSVQSIYSQIKRIKQMLRTRVACRLSQQCQTPNNGGG